MRPVLGMFEPQGVGLAAVRVGALGAQCLNGAGAEGFQPGEDGLSGLLGNHGLGSVPERGGPAAMARTMRIAGAAIGARLKGQDVLGIPAFDAGRSVGLGTFRLFPRGVPGEGQACLFHNRIAVHGKSGIETAMPVAHEGGGFPPKNPEVRHAGSFLRQAKHLRPIDGTRRSGPQGLGLARPHRQEYQKPYPLEESRPLDIVINILLPVFGIAAIGYAAARMRWFAESAESGVSNFVFNYAVPFMLFRTIATTDLPDRMPWDLFGSYYLPAFTVYGIGMALGRFVFGRDAMGAILTGMGSAFSNTVLLGLPLILLAYGEAAALPFFLILSVHGLLLFTGTTIMLELARSAGGSLAGVPAQVVLGLIRNPILIGLAAGLTANLAGLELPVPVARIAETFQGAVLPCALFVLGASLKRYGVAGRVVQSLAQVSLKLLVFPALVYLAGTYVFDLDPIWVQIAVITAAQPSGVMVYLFAQRYGTAQALATTSIFLATVGSAFTSWAILWLFSL